MTINLLMKVDKTDSLMTPYALNAKKRWRTDPLCVARAFFFFFKLG